MTLNLLQKNKLVQSLFLMYWCQELTFKISLFKRILANSVNIKCRLFQVKINCSNLIIDRLQQRCNVTFLIYFFVTSRNLFVWCISAKENNYNLTKNSRKFQASVTETCTFSVSAKSFEGEKVESLKLHCCTWFSSDL